MDKFANKDHAYFRKYFQKDELLNRGFIRKWRLKQ